MRTETIQKGNAAVLISVGEATVWANLWVNTRHGFTDATITNTTWRGKTLAGARRWANKQLDSH